MCNDFRKYAESRAGSEIDDTKGSGMKACLIVKQSVRIIHDYFQIARIISGEETLMQKTLVFATLLQNEAKVRD